ncbi:MAG: fliS [Phycisphaerales bacterium]|jgi:flagellar protein FliS|nr:fliS [Phycisphaerales bacterium]
MNPQGAQNYLRTKVLTATPEQLQLMLYDGALRFGEQARVALEQKNFEQSYSMISRVQKIITEMQSSLKPAVAPDLCKKMSALYNFIYMKLVDANLEHQMSALDEALSILRYQRETWAMLLEQLGKTKAAAAASNLDMPAPDARMEASIRISA